jgi:hypothetical protein
MLDVWCWPNSAAAATRAVRQLSGDKLPLTAFGAGRPQLGDTPFASDNRNSRTLFSGHAISNNISIGQSMPRFLPPVPLGLDAFGPDLLRPQSA